VRVRVPSGPLERKLIMFNWLFRDKEREKAEAKTVTLYFNGCKISFIDRAETIRAKRYDFSQFGPIVSWSGENAETVVTGASAIKRSPTNEKQDL